MFFPFSCAMNSAYFRRLAAAVLAALFCFLSPAAPAEAQLSGKEYDLISDIVYSYRMNPDSSQARIREDLASLKSVNPALGKTWEELMD